MLTSFLSLLLGVGMFHPPTVVVLESQPLEVETSTGEDIHLAADTWQRQMADTVKHKQLEQQTPVSTARDLPVELTLTPGQMTLVWLEAHNGSPTRLRLTGVEPQHQVLRAVSSPEGKPLNVGQDGHYWGVEGTHTPVLLGLTTSGQAVVDVVLLGP